MTSPSVAWILCSSGSWVELEGLISSVGHTEAESGAEGTSVLQGELERILLEAQLEGDRSPPQIVTPRTSGSPKPSSEGSSSSTDCVTIQ
ncbi:hypothetical protein DNTS_006366, partial [Danionella cerebrum]